MVTRCALTAAAVTPLLRWAVLHHAVPAGQLRRRACPGCATPIGLTAAAHRAPLLPTGRCRVCGTRIGAPPYTVEAAALLAVAALLVSGLSSWPLAAYTWWTAAALVLAFVDATGRVYPTGRWPPP